MSVNFRTSIKTLCSLFLSGGFVSFLLWLIWSYSTGNDTRACVFFLMMRSGEARRDALGKSSLFKSAPILAESKYPHSWRISPPEQYAVPGYRYDQPWNGPENRLLRDPDRERSFHCVTDPGPEGMTSYAVVVGPTTPFPGDRNVAVPLDLEVAQNTILFVEMCKSGIHWMEPRDLPFEQAIKGINLTNQISISSKHTYFGGSRRNGAFAGFADGSARFLNSKVDPKVLRSLLEIDSKDKPKERVEEPRR